MDLSREQVEVLRVSRPWLRKRDQTYGRSLEQVVRDASEGEFLADAVDTGHVPEFEGIKLALDATRCMMESAATTYVRDGRSDFAASALYGTADELRAIAGRLLKDAEALETLGSDLGLPTAASA